MNISAKLKVSASKSATSPSCKTLQASVGRHRNIMSVDNKSINLEPEIKT